MPLSNVTPIGAARRKRYGDGENMKCECGSEWWDVGVTIDAATRQISGRHTIITCRVCGKAKVHVW